MRKVLSIAIMSMLLASTPPAEAQGGPGDAEISYSSPSVSFATGGPYGYLQVQKWAWCTNSAFLNVDVYVWTGNCATLVIRAETMEIGWATIEAWGRATSILNGFTKGTGEVDDCTWGKFSWPSFVMACPGGGGTGGGN